MSVPLIGRTRGEAHIQTRTSQRGCVSGALNAFGVKALWPFGNFKLYALAFRQAAETFRLDCRLVHEYIPATIAGDEAVSL